MKKGILLAATFSFGCNRANQLSITSILKQYSESEGKSHSDEEIRRHLEKLFSYIYYLVIARSNEIEDPFDIRVVEAHWVGNELLDNVKLSVVKDVLEEMASKHDKVILALVAKPLIETGSAHHNAYSNHNPYCSVTLKNGFFYHLGIPRKKATQQEIENLEKYGGRG